VHDIAESDPLGRDGHHFASVSRTIRPHAAKRVK
jgi:hypothetical protein